jgi:uncharacterized protein YicC (UPF0701 family)
MYIFRSLLKNFISAQYEEDLATEAEKAADEAVEKLLRMRLAQSNQAKNYFYTQVNTVRRLMDKLNVTDLRVYKYDQKM